MLLAQEFRTLRVGTDGAIDEDAAAATAGSDDGCKQRLRLRAATGAAEGIRATTCSESAGVSGRSAPDSAGAMAIPTLPALPKDKGPNTAATLATMQHCFFRAGISSRSNHASDVEAKTRTAAQANSAPHFLPPEGRCYNTHSAFA